MKNNYSFPIVIAITVGILILTGVLLARGVLNLGTNPGQDSTSLSISAEDVLNKPAPAFALTGLDGKAYSSETFRGKTVILFFNEGLRCYPACWNAMIALGGDERFQTANTVAYSVVMDSEGEWGRAQEKVPELQKVNVLFDKDKSVSQSFGMLDLPSSMHKGSLLGHTYVVIDKEGIVRSIIDDPRMGVLNDELVKVLEKLNPTF